MQRFPLRARHVQRIGRQARRSRLSRLIFVQHVAAFVRGAVLQDIDDALSVRVLPGSGDWEVGVHIADVTHFVKQGGALDRLARRRATTVYVGWGSHRAWCRLD